MSEWDYGETIFCVPCGEELRLFVEATKWCRGVEVCDDCFHEGVI